MVLGPSVGVEPLTAELHDGSVADPAAFVHGHSIGATGWCRPRPAVGPVLQRHFSAVVTGLYALGELLRGRTLVSAAAHLVHGSAVMVLLVYARSTREESRSLGRRVMSDTVAAFLAGWRGSRPGIVRVGARSASPSQHGHRMPGVGPPARRTHSEAARSGRRLVPCNGTSAG